MQCASQASPDSDPAPLAPATAVAHDQSAADVNAAAHTWHAVLAWTGPGPPAAWDAAAQSEPRLLRADIDDVSLHAAAHGADDDRQALKQLCRYVTCPDLASERMQANAARQVVLKLNTPQSHGTTHLVMSLLELMQRLAALVPTPQTAPDSLLICVTLLDLQEAARGG